MKGKKCHSHYHCPPFHPSIKPDPRPSLFPTTTIIITTTAAVAAAAQIIGNSKQISKNTRSMSGIVSWDQFECEGGCGVIHQREREMEINEPKKKKKCITSGKKLEGGSIKRRSSSSSSSRSRKGLLELDLEGVASIDKENLSKREIHIYSERFRRKKMAHMFSNVISLLPNANLKRDRCMILMELICYIKALQNKIEEMGRRKQKLLARSTDCYKRNTTTTTKNNNNKDSNAKVEVNVSGNDLLITMNGAILRGNSWSMILEALDELELEVVTTTLSTAFDSHFLFIHAKILDMSAFKNKEEIKAVLLQLFI